MAIEIGNRCIKMALPNGNVVDILSSVFEEMSRWLQRKSEDCEGGGYIVGYKHSKTDNISLESVSHPYPKDSRNRIRFNIVDSKHKLFLVKSQRRKSYYMGVWHTHPQTIPEPSGIDWNDWYETLSIDRTACRYAFFIIAGTEGARVWVGDFESGQIVEIFECEKEGDLYKS